VSNTTIAISTYKRSSFGWVVELLKSLENQSLRDFEIILVVNRDARYFEKLRHFLKRDGTDCIVNVIFNPVDKGIAYSRNIALQNAKTQYIAYTDDDAIPDVCWLEQLVQTLEMDEKVGAATGPVLPLWEVSAQKYAFWFPKELYWVLGCTPQNKKGIEKVRNGYASNLALKRELALELGGFNEKYGYNPKIQMAGEEPEFGIRLAEAGYVTLWTPNAVVHHRLTAERFRIRNVLKRSFVEGKTKACLSRAFGRDALRLEENQLESVARAFVKSKTLRAKTLLLITTLAVLAGYAQSRFAASSTNLSIRMSASFQTQ
jgi:glycosyltransferase involved in cell wall biosynthesis